MQKSAKLTVFNQNEIFKMMNSYMDTSRVNNFDEYLKKVDTDFRTSSERVLRMKVKDNLGYCLGDLPQHLENSERLSSFLEILKTQDASSRNTLETISHDVMKEFKNQRTSSIVIENFNASDKKKLQEFENIDSADESEEVEANEDEKAREFSHEFDSSKETQSQKVKPKPSTSSANNSRPISNLEKKFKKRTNEQNNLKMDFYI